MRRCRASEGGRGPSVASLPKGPHLEQQRSGGDPAGLCPRQRTFHDRISALPQPHAPHPGERGSSRHRALRAETFTQSLGGGFSGVCLVASPWRWLESAMIKSGVSWPSSEAVSGEDPLPLPQPRLAHRPPCAPSSGDAAGLRGVAVVVLGAVRRPVRAARGQEQDALRPCAARQPRGALPGAGGGGPVRPRQLRLTPGPPSPLSPAAGDLRAETGTWPGGRAAREAHPGREIPQTWSPGSRPGPPARRRETNTCLLAFPSQLLNKDQQET